MKRTQKNFDIKKIYFKNQWQKENKKVINEYNKNVQKNGVFSDGVRGF